MTEPTDEGEDRARLSERLITAEQDERRRLALFLHDGPVQSLAGIALMLDAVMHAIDEENLDAARSVLTEALERHRAAIRALRDLSFNLEPVVLRDQGFTPAVQALADELGLRARDQDRARRRARRRARGEGSSRALPDRPRGPERRREARPADADQRRRRARHGRALRRHDRRRRLTGAAARVLRRPRGAGAHAGRPRLGRPVGGHADRPRAAPAVGRQ